MKNQDNPQLLKRKQQIDAERRAQAILRKRHQHKLNLEAIAKVAAASGVKA